ncbi:MAG: hypothetical protein QOG25_3585 [Acetobacteraceae bacterium]|nr:hypothetical protein [Acetobacteraceae bacterium]
MADPLSEIFAILRALLHDSDQELTPATRFGDLAGWDSMDLVTVAVEAECRFDLLFDSTEIDQFVTIADLLRAITTKQALASA